MNKILRLVIIISAGLGLVRLFMLALPTSAARNDSPEASIVVDTLEDELNSDGDCSLRKAITAANTNATTDACPSGDGVLTDTITFSMAGTITRTEQHSVNPTDQSSSRPFLKKREEYNRLELAPKLPDIQNSSVIPSYGSWSMIVFESYRDGNWEIYSANGDGTDQSRLTENGAFDLHPRLNRGCTHIAFASNRDGDIEIYTIRLDGSELKQLTFNAEDDTNPFWSPDGSKIVFQSYRDNQAEIYVINADGSNPVRLTSNSAYDGEPAWSPDGNKIAFTSKRDGGYRIWIMNANGAGQVPLSIQQLSENPVWSPDGTMIAYDSDANDDGWQELWLMTHDGSTQQLVYDPGESQTDAWARSWSPDGRYVTFTRVSWVYYQGEWYWTKAYLDAWDSQVSGSTIRLSTSGVDWDPDWQTIDAYPPVSHIMHLPEYSRASGFDVQWTGRDPGNAGITGFDIQFRVGTNGQWNNWKPNTTATSAIFSGSPSDTIFFRSRARDSALNLEPWPISTSGDTSTRLYSWNLTGQVIDNRANPSPGASILISPLPLSTVNTNFAGKYNGRLAYSDTYTLQVSQDGYGGFPTAVLEIDSDRSFDTYLPPDNDLIQNGGFESGWDSWIQWIDPPTVTETQITLIDQGHTGDHAVRISPDCAYPCITAPEIAPVSSIALSMATDQEGGVHIVWWDYGDPSIYYLVRNPVGEWGIPEKLITKTDPNFSTAIAVDHQGNVHLIWDDEDRLYYSQKADGSSSWTPPEQFAEVGRTSAIAADQLGGLHVITFGPEEILYYRRSPQGLWQAAVVLSEEPGYYAPGLAVGPDNTVHFIWQEAGIFYRSRSPSGELSETERLFNGFGYSNHPQIIVSDSEGNLHAYWQWSRSGYYASRNIDGVWTPPRELPHAYGQAYLAVDSIDTVHMVGWSSAEGFYYRKKELQGIWSDPVLIDDYPGSPAPLQFGISKDLFHLFRGDLDTNALVYHTNLQASEGYRAALSQNIQIPDDIHKSTLAFYYKLTGLSTDSKTFFEVTISDTLSATNLLSTMDTVLWNHEWFDVSNWAGKVVTLTFKINQVADEPFAYLDLDEVSLGPWNTPIISEITPSHLENYSSATITIYGDNFIETPTVKLGNTTLLNIQWIDEQILQARIPGSIAPGDYDLWVINPGGQPSVSHNGIVLGWRFFLPLTLRW